MYYGKWVQYVQSFAVSDILPSVPAEFRSQYNDVDLSSKVKVDAKFSVASSNQIYVSAASASINRQKSSKQSLKSRNITYILKTTKTVGSGRKLKYQEQETFIVQSVLTGWETGNPLSKSTAYDVLISKFGHENETDRTEWEKIM